MLTLTTMKALLACRRAVAAMEFAILTPVMAVMLIGVFDITKAVILWQQVGNVAHTLPISASNLSVQTDKTNTLTKAQVQQLESLIYAEMPWIRDGIETGDASVTLSSVTFTPIAGCSNPAQGHSCFLAQLAWSVPYLGTSTANFATPLIRNCLLSPIAQIGPTDPIPLLGNVLTVLRTVNITAPDPIFVADVHYSYTPKFFKFLTGKITFWAYGYWSVRTVQPGATQYATYDLANEGNGYWKCPGF